MAHTGVGVAAGKLLYCDPVYCTLGFCMSSSYTKKF